MDKKILVAYFSYSGNTKSIAEKIHEETGGDIFRIETAQSYPLNYDETAYGIAKEQHEKKIMPELKEYKNVSKYDVIFIGTPVWWYEIAPAVKTFLTNNSFNNKIIVPFITHGGGGKYNIKQEFEALTKTTVLEPLVIYENGGKSTSTNISGWINHLDL